MIMGLFNILLGVLGLIVGQWTQKNLDPSKPAWLGGLSVGMLYLISAILIVVGSIVFLDGVGS